MRFHHVANGTCTTNLIHRAGIPGTTSIWADVLHEGPVPAALTDDQLLETRARQLAPDSQESIDAVSAEFRQWRAAVDDVSAYDELVLWYEHDLFDQLNLIQLLSRIRETVGAARPVKLICIGSFPDHPHFKGLGELTPRELAALFDTRLPVSDAEYALAARAWQAFRAPDPREIERLVDGDTRVMPYLAPALRRSLEELPWTTDGLSRTERRLLQLIDGGTTALHAAFPLMHAGESAFYISDGALWSVVSGLASAVHPLLTLDVHGDSNIGLPRATMALSDTGRSVLTGEQDHVHVNGIDRWLGGAHLTDAHHFRYAPDHCQLVIGN